MTDTQTIVVEVKAPEAPEQSTSTEAEAIADATETIVASAEASVALAQQTAAAANLEAAQTISESEEKWRTMEARLNALTETVETQSALIGSLISTQIKTEEVVQEIQEEVTPAVEVINPDAAPDDQEKTEQADQDNKPETRKPRNVRFPR